MSTPTGLPSLLAPRSPWAVAGMVAAVLNAALRVAIIPLFVTPVVDRVLTQGEVYTLAAVLGGAAAVTVAGAVALWAQDACLARAAAQVAARWREGLYRRLLRTPPGGLPGSSGGLSGRVLTDLREVETYYQFGLGSLVAESLTLLGILGVLFYSDALASLALLGLMLPIALGLRAVGGRLERVATRSQHGTEALGAHLQEGLKHHEVVRAFGADDFMLSRFSQVNRLTARAMARRGVLAGVQIPLAQVLLFAAIGVLVVILARRAVAGALSTGQVVSYLTLVALMTTPAQLLPRAYALLQQASAASRRLHALLDATPTLPPARASQATPPLRRVPTLELRNLSFAYGETPPSREVLREVSLELRGPRLVALTGVSGAGKTTLLRLLLRFLTPTQGDILVAGVPLHSLSERALSRAIGYVPQGLELLSGSLRDNLLLGRACSDAHIWRVLRSLGLEGLRGLPGGLAHDLSEDGAGLSGGQRQRLAVARALLGEPPILLLDEPTSALDAHSEATLVWVLRAQAQQRLVLVVAHRPALAEAADEVIILSDTRLLRHPAGTVVGMLEEA